MPANKDAKAPYSSKRRENVWHLREGRSRWISSDELDPTHRLDWLIYCHVLTHPPASLNA